MPMGRNILILILGSLVVSGNAIRAADSLRWDVNRDRVDAAIETWTVPEMLQHVATATGWKIYLDPGITNRIPTRFTAKEPGEALQKLLGGFSYALVPETNARPRLLVFRNSREQATRAIQALTKALPKASTNRIGNELIVTLKPGENIEDLARKLGAKIVGRSDAQNTYRLRFDDEKAADTGRASLKDDPSVETIDSNFHVSRPESAQLLGTGGGPIGLTPKVSVDGKSQVVGMIDSAIQPKQGGFTDFIANGAALSPESASAVPTHGTSMAATLLRGLASLSEDKSSSVNIYPVDVFGEGETTSTYDIAVGLFKAAEGKARIFSMPLGGDGDSSFLHNTIKSIYDQGGVLIAAGGNSPTTTPTYPAAYPEVIAVGATARNGDIASYSNRGAFIDAWAPGDSLVSFNGQLFHVVGTSASTSYAASLAVHLAETKNLSGAALRAAVIQSLAGKK